MKTRLIKQGDELALVIDKSILKRLNINEKTKLQITEENNALVIILTTKEKPTPKKKDKKEFKEKARKIVKEHESVFKKLAKT